VDSKNSLTIVADFSCPICRAKWPIFNGIFKKYKDRMRFEYISLAPSNSFSILFAECASKQGKFWQAHDLLFEQNVVVADSFFLDTLVSQLKLDEKECMNCIRSIDHTKRIYTSMEKLRSQGIDGTPTILINNRIFYGDIGNESLSRFIDDLLTHSPKSGISHNE
jgi:protein-disulfide isomerase